ELNSQQEYLRLKARYEALQPSQRKPLKKFGSKRVNFEVL
nr:hypothetical protein [Tanacetum cinerariifolium]